MDRRGFFRGLFGAAAAVVLAPTLPITRLLDAAVEEPVFHLEYLPLPIVHSDFYFSARKLVTPMPCWSALPVIYEELAE